MLLVEKRRIYEQQLDANVVITSLEEDKSKVTDLMTEFNVVGLSYVYLVKGKKIEKDFWYWRACEENMSAKVLKSECKLKKRGSARSVLVRSRAYGSARTKRNSLYLRHR